MTISTQQAAVQIGKESTWGTAVAQTAKLPHLEDFKIKPVIASNRYKSLGDVAAGTQHVITGTSATGTMSGRANYGILPVWHENLFGAATTAGSDPYTHTFTPDTTAVITRKSHTLCKKDGAGDAVTLSGALITSYNLKATPGEAIMESIDWVGNMADDGSFTAGQSDFTDADQLLRPSDVTFYLDAAGSAGTTSLACSAKSFDLTITAATKLIPGLGTTESCAAITDEYDVTLSLSGESDNATIKSRVEALLGNDPTAASLDVQISITMSANYSWVIIVPMRFSEAPEWHDDIDGVSTFTMNLYQVKDSASSATNGFLDSVVTNTDAVV